MMDISYYKEKYEPIDGKWYINKQLGKGAFGSVFEIERRDFTTEKSALKIISIPSSQSEVDSYKEENYELDEKSVTSYFYGFVEEFTKEFKLMSKLKGNSNIVSIEDYDVKKKDGEIGWDIFIRMELLTPINKHFQTHPPTQNDIIKLGIDICKALEICKKQQIIHRDIKPSNIFISSTGDFKLGDFGVARTLEKTSSGLSKKGTYTYMAPEVYKGEAYNSSIDMYSLGIVMYKLLNNNFEPFRTENSFIDEENALIRRMKGEKFPNKPKKASKKLADIIFKACSFSPEDRYKSPTDMKFELKSILETPESLVDEESGVFFKPIDNLSTGNGKVSTESDEIIISKMINYIFIEFRNMTDVDITTEEIAVMRIAEFLKKRIDEIRSGNTVLINLPFIAATDKGPIHMNMEISIDKITLGDDTQNKTKGSVHSTEYGYKQIKYKSDNFNADIDRSVFRHNENNSEETIGIFSSRRTKNNPDEPSDDYYANKSEYDSVSSDDLIIEADKGDDDAILEVSYRYIISMIKVRYDFDVYKNRFNIKKLVYSKIVKVLPDIKKGNIIFFRVTDFSLFPEKISIDFSWKNAHDYILLPIENIDDSLRKGIIDRNICNYNLAYEKNDKLEAIKSCISALSYDYKLVDTWVTLGKCYREHNLYNRALECYEIALKLDPTFGKAYLNSATAYTLLNKNIQAADCYEKALSLLDKRSYDYAVTLANYALVKAKLGNKQKAKSLLRQAKKIGYKDYKLIKEMIK